MSVDIDNLISNTEASQSLAHHGIKGMKWGQRRTEAQLARARATADSIATKTASARSRDKNSIVKTKKGYSSGEALSAKELQSIAKKYGTSALTNQDLRQLNERLNLEKNYSNLSPKQKTKLQKTASGVASTVKVASKVDKSLGSPVGNAAKDILDSKLREMGVPVPERKKKK